MNRDDIMRLVAEAAIKSKTLLRDDEFTTKQYAESREPPITKTVALRTLEKLELDGIVIHRVVTNRLWAWRLTEKGKARDPKPD